VLGHGGGSCRVAKPATTAGAGFSAAALAGLPQKRPSFGVRSRQLDLCFIAFRRDGAMGLFLVLLWCAAVTGDILRYNSRFGGFNSRLGRWKFPFSPATGIGRQGLDLSWCFRSRDGTYREQSKKFPVPREKPGISPSPAERVAEQPAPAPISVARARRLVACQPRRGSPLRAMGCPAPDQAEGALSVPLPLQHTPSATVLSERARALVRQFVAVGRCWDFKRVDHP
jgi:hypothetical protein